MNLPEGRDMDASRIRFTLCKMGRSFRDMLEKSTLSGKTSDPSLY